MNSIASAAFIFWSLGSLTLGEFASTIRRGADPKSHELVLGGSHLSCLNNSTDDLGLQSSDPLSFEHLDLPTADAILPSHGPSIGGNEVDGTTLDSAVSSNGVESFGGDGGSVQFTHDDRFIVRSVVPSHGFVSGGTPVEVSGSGFAWPGIDALTCVFGNREVAAERVDENTLRCISPAHTKAKVTVSARQGHRTWKTKALFEFVKDAIIHRTAPSEIPALDGSDDGEGIWVYGNHFLNTSDDLSCLYKCSLSETKYPGSQPIMSRVPAVFHNTTVLQCPEIPSLLPFFSAANHSWSRDASLFEGASFHLSVTTNGVDISRPRLLTFLADHNVESIFPRTGARSGGTAVAVRGTNFSPLDSLACKFGDLAPTAAEYRSHKDIICIAPPNDDGVGSIRLAVEVTNNGRHFTSSGILFEYHEDIVIESLSPNVGKSSGGTVVTITLDENSIALKPLSFNRSTSVSFGVHTTVGVPTPADQVYVQYEEDLTDSPSEEFSFRSDYGTPTCKFNNTIVPGTILRNRSLSCIAPPAAHAHGGPVALEVSHNGVDFTGANSLTFFYLRGQKAEALRIVPSHGPRAGGTLVRVGGITSVPFDNEDVRASLRSSGALCKFGNEIFAALDVSIEEDGTFITCSSPPASSNGNVSSIPVDVSIAGQREAFTEIGAMFRYEPDHSVSIVKPSLGPVYGGTTVKVTGGPFVNSSSELLCRFGDRVVNASWRSTSDVECDSPRLGSIDEVQTVSIFSMAFSPEIQSISAFVDDYVSEIHTISTMGISNPLPEVQRVDISNKVNEGSSFFRLKVADNLLTGPITAKASELEVKQALEEVAGVDNVTVELSRDVWDGRSWIITFSTIGNLPSMEIDASDLHGAVSTVQNGTDLIADDKEGRGFRLVTPGGSLTYPLSQVTRWIHHNETAQGMKDALIKAGGLPHGFDVSRFGPYGNGFFDWEVTLPKGASLNGATMHVVNHGGGAVRLQGTNASVRSVIARRGTTKLAGQFRLQIVVGEENEMREETRLLNHNSTNQELKKALEELSSVTTVSVAQDSLDQRGTGNGAVRWDVTFTSLKEAGDVPLLSAMSSQTLTGSGASIRIEEHRKGSSNAVYKLLVPRAADSFVLKYDGVAGPSLPSGAPAASVEMRLRYFGVASSVVERVEMEENFEYYILCAAGQRQSLNLLLGAISAEISTSCSSQSGTCLETTTLIAWAPDTAVPLGGSFALSFETNATSSCPSRHAWGEYYVDTAASPCLHETDSIASSASVMDVERALEGLPFIEDVDVTLTESQVALKHKVPVASGVVGQCRNFHVHFRRVKRRSFGVSLFQHSSSLSGDIPLLQVDGTRLLGVPSRDAALLPDYQAKVFSVVNGTDLDLSGTVSVDVSMNGGHDWSSSNVMFRYHPMPIVTSLEPHHGPRHGGTRIRVKGENFARVSSLVCIFSIKEEMGPFSSPFPYSVPVSTYLSSSQVECVAPPSMIVRTVFVSVSLNGAGADSFGDLQEAGEPFEYDEPILISKVIPSSGPSSGGFRVRVTGGPFIPSNATYCRFETHIVPGVYASSSQIECVAPPHAPGIYTLEVTQNGQDFTDGRFAFQYYHDVKLSHMQPISGPALAAGTQVRLFGQGFLNSTALLCRFGSTEVPAKFASHEEIVCATPPVHRAGDMRWLALSEQRNHLADKSRRQELFPYSHHYPLYMASLVSVEVTNNAQDYTHSGLSFLYQNDIVISKVHNAYGPNSGGTPIFVRGSGFVNSTQLSCRIGQRVIEAHFLTREAVLCFTPPQYAAESMHETEAPQFLGRPSHLTPAVVFIDVSNNGVDFTTYRNTFAYAALSPGGRYQPGVENETLAVCPRGSYCYGEGQTNFTLCPPGTYQPLKGQSGCVRCPIGYMCPEFGLPVPRLCPAGFVCDVTGTERAEQPCPAGYVCSAGTATTATTCGGSSLSYHLTPSLTLGERTSTIRRGADPKGHELVLGGRHSACWNNSTDDFGLQSSNLPARIWAEKHLLPLDSEASVSPMRGRFCLDDACVVLEDADNLGVTDISFDYTSTGFALRRPVPCPAGKYCHPGTAVNETTLHLFTSPQPCLDSMYCPEASSNPNGFGDCPRGYFCRFGKRTPCPVGSYCPGGPFLHPLPCEPGSFSFMVGQYECTPCPIGAFCQGYGRIDPALCPPGFVCSSPGLASPNIRCPAGFYCPNGTATSDPFRNDTTLRPYACAPGSYCIGGTGFDTTKEGDFLYAQPCPAGFFCEAGSTSPIGSGLCPRGFTCPKGSATPRPTPKGHYAKHIGTVEAAACLPGYYAPTIQTADCYPCPPGTSCEIEGLFEAQVCPPGTYRSTLEDDGLPCLSCPQGTWSKNWHLREKGECTRCPTGVMCPTDGMTRPCGSSDLPQPYEPVVNLNGIPVPQYEFPAGPDMPPYFSIDECLKMNAGYEDGKMDPRLQRFFFGELIPPYIDVLGRGAHFRSTDQTSLKYSNVAKCFRNDQPHGSILYRRMVDYYGPQYDLQTGHPHQGYGTSSLLNQMYAVSPPPGYDFSLKYFHGAGTTFIELPHARTFEPSFNCTPGFHLMNSTLLRDDNGGSIVYTDPAYDYEGGYDIERCPNYDSTLDCYIDDEGECCHVPPGRQRAIQPSHDQFYHGTCEADIICLEEGTAEATECRSGFVCDEETTLEGGTRYACPAGYSCGFGTTPDPSLEAPKGKFTKLCPDGSYCKDGTGTENEYTRCPADYACPTGTADPLIGSVAEDSLNRDLGEAESDPAHNAFHLRYLANDLMMIMGEHDMKCLNGVDESLRGRHGLIWQGPKDVLNPHLEYLTQVVDQNSDGMSDMPYNSHSEDGPLRPKVLNEATSFDLSCSRDHKWRLVDDAVKRQECNCNAQFFIIAAVYRLWKCTATEPLDDYGVGTARVPASGRGERDYWHERIHRDYDLAIAMDEAMEGYGLKWGNGSVCEWPDSKTTISLTEGRIPYEGEHPFDGQHGRYIHPMPGKGIPAESGGFLSLTNHAISPREVDVRFPIQFTWTEQRLFANYTELKRAVKDEYTKVLHHKQRTGIDPFIFDLHRAVEMIERYGEKLERLVYFRNKTASDDASHVLWLGTSMPGGNHGTVDDSRLLVPARLDSCECQNLLKCPNGTTTATDSGAVSLEECKRTSYEVLRRVSLLPLQSSISSRVSNDTDIESLELDPLEVAKLTLDLTDLGNNFTYGDHYHFSVYDTCKPCPPRYHCEWHGEDDVSCTTPSLSDQEALLNKCLRDNRVGACVRSDGTSVDYQWCEKEAALHDKGIYSNEEIEAFESTYLVYTQPDLLHCLSMPYFGADTTWNYRTFRKLCQDTLRDGRLGPTYDCSLVDRWDEYDSWRNDMCCSGDPEFDGVDACKEGRCSHDSKVEAILERFLHLFIQQHGFTPPDARPLGVFLMDAVAQEEIGHPSPLDLFNEWKEVPKKGVPGQMDATLHPHNHFDPDSSTPWLERAGCCRCERHSMPGYFEIQDSDSGFPDNKHRQIQLAITALAKVSLTVVVELLHGKYYTDFDTYFIPRDRSKLHVHSPSRFAYGPDLKHEVKPRSMWMAMIEKEIFESLSMELPLNLPHETLRGQRRSFENRILIDRPSDIRVGYSDYRPQRNNHTDGENNKVVSNNDTMTSNNVTNDDDQYVNDDGRKIALPYAVRDDYSSVYESELWWTHGDQTQGPATSSSEFTFITLPYLPFFSNCNGYDSHMSLSRLLEEHPNCTLVDYDNTVTVSPMPWFNAALSPLSDTCLSRDQKAMSRNSTANDGYPPMALFGGIDIHCSYEEQVDEPNQKLRWYEVEGGTSLFYITRDAIPPEIFEASLADSPLRSTAQPWGRTYDLDRIRDSHNVIPVTVDEVMGGLRNAIPRNVELELPYYQVNRGEKHLVQAKLYFSDLCTTLKPETFGGNVERLALMAEKGIYPCDVDINGRIKSFDYNLEVRFYPLDWFNLLNKFQFDGGVYLAFYTLVGLCGAVASGLVWGGSRLLSRLKFPPKFHGSSLIKLISGPQWLGCALAAIPYAVCLSVVYFWFGGNEPSAFAFAAWHADWMSTGVLDNDDIEQHLTGRMGTALLAIGIYITVLGASLLVPEPKDPIRDKKNADVVATNNSNEDGENCPPPSSAWAPTRWKRAHLMWLSFCLQCVLLCVWEFSYSLQFEANIYRFIVYFKIAQMVIELVLANILKESLMLAPLLVAIEVTEILVTIGAKDFVDFTLSHFIEMSVILAERLYLDPFVKMIKNLWPRWKMMLGRKFGTRRRLTRAQKEAEERKWRQVNEDIELRSEGVEPLLDSFGLYSIEKTGGILSPLICLVVMVFSRQTEIAKNYGVQQNELAYYALFGLYMIPWTSVVDALILNTQELVYGWRLYDYLAYQRYRFSTREKRWVLCHDATMDESISPGLQTLDLLCFSSQHYFLLSMFALGMVTNMLAVTIFLRAKYNFLGDPAMPIISLVMILFCELVRFAMRGCVDLFGLWETKRLEGTMDDVVAAKLAIGEGRQADLEQERLELQALNSERFRHRFLDRNTPWVLQHLVELITPRSLKSTGPDGRPLNEYVRDIYSDLITMGEGARRPGDRSDISSDDSDDDELEKRRQWDQTPLHGAPREIALMWVQKARKYKSFGRAVAGIFQKEKKSTCTICLRKKEMCKSLVVGLASNGMPDPYALDSLIAQFEREYSVSETSLDLWKSFFRTEAQFVTTCEICRSKSSLPSIVRHPGGDRPTRAGDISSDEEDDDVTFEPLIIERSSNEGRMMSKWLTAARTKLGGTFPRPSAKQENERHVSRIKKKKIREATKEDLRDKAAEQSFGRVNLNTVSEKIVKTWLEAARDSQASRFEARSKELRFDLHQTLEQVSDDSELWYFGEQLRSEGFSLKAEGEHLERELEELKAEASSEIRRVESRLVDVKKRSDDLLDSKRQKLEHDCKNERERAHASMELRMRELRRACDDLRDRQQEERERMRAREGAISSDVVQKHENETQALDTKITKELETSERAMELAENERRKIFETEEKIIRRDVSDAERRASLEIETIKKRNRSIAMQKEKQWRTDALRWLALAKRKVSVKKKEDKSAG